MPIRVLDAETVGRIAAGEVVERPASVMKELVENALDAGSTSITVEIKDGGVNYMRITDNGCGIPAEEARLAFENHATSKITAGDALTDIRTLGFRGEALPSIASVSRVSMTTRARGLDSGIRISIEGGAVTEVTETGCPEGTTIIVRDLFFNTPVRREFLKKPATEAGVLIDMLARLMLGNPGVSIRMISNGRTIYHSFGDGDMRHTALAVYGREVAERLIFMDEQEGGLRIQGLIGVGEISRSNRSHQSFFINGRVVRCRLLSNALEEVTRGRVMIGQYPICALAVYLPPHSVDINVHPNKLEVRFRDEMAMQLSVEALLVRAFHTQEPMLNPERLVAPPAPEEKRAPLRVEEPQNEQKTEVSYKQTEVFDKTTEPPRPALQTDNSLFLQESWIAARPPEPKPEPTPVHADSKYPAPAAPVAVAAADTVSPPVPMRIIGVFLSTYILIEAGDSLLIIDQHAAHERLIYEQLERSIEKGSAMQQLLTPMITPMSPRERAILLDNRELLLQAGYDVEPFGERDVQVRGVPFVLGKAELRPLFVELIDRLDQLKNATLERRRTEIMLSSCKRAVKAGDHLTEAEIHALVSDMMKTGAPPTCPHGRPVVKVLRRTELERMFKRI